MQCGEESMVVFRDSSIAEEGFKLLALDSHNNEPFSSTTDQTQSTNTTPLANTKSYTRRNYDVNSLPTCKVTLNFQMANSNCNELKKSYQNTSICGK